LLEELDLELVVEEVIIMQVAVVVQLLPVLTHLQEHQVLVVQDRQLVLLEPI
jgi:hypothetical protein